MLKEDYFVSLRLARFKLQLAYSSDDDKNNKLIMNCSDTLNNIALLNDTYSKEESMTRLKKKMNVSTKNTPKRTVKKVKNECVLKKNSCAVCNASLNDKTELLNHYFAHKEQKIKENLEMINSGTNQDFFRCCICMEEFASQALLNEHGAFHDERPYLCLLCNKCIKQTAYFLRHMSCHIINIREFICDLCKFSTRFKSAFVMHSKLHKREKYKCDLCDKVFLTRTALDEHNNYHTGAKTFACDECEKCFLYRTYLTEHKKNIHQPNVNKCDVCKKQFSSKSNYTRHMSMHTGSRDQICDICGKTFGALHNLNLHKRIHTGYKPYSCAVCGKCFRKKDKLTVHMRVHTGEKPYGCETCGKHFPLFSSLVIHKRSHTGERPYVCHLCNKGFVTRGLLGTHLKKGNH